MSKNLKHIGVVSALTFLSRILGLIRDSLSLAVFGTTWLMSAFNTAFILPNLFRRLLAEGSMTAAFVPTLQQELHRGGKEGAFRLLSKVTSWLLVLTSVVVGTAMVLFGHSRLMVGHEQKWYVGADLTVLLFPYLVFICLSAACSAALNVLGRFTEPALSPIWLNLAMILSLGGAGLHFAKTPLDEMHWLCWGVLTGGFFQMAVPAAVLLVEGWRPTFDLGLTEPVREIAVLMTPGLFGTAIYQINLSVSRLLAFSIDDASATYLYTMSRLMELPIGVVAIAVSTVVYPLIARHAVQGNQEGMSRDFLKGIRLILILNIPAAIGLALLRGPIVRLIYKHGQVTALAAHDMGFLLALFAIGLPFFSVVSLTVRAFYAMKDTKTPVRIAVIDFILNIVISLTLIPRLGVVGLVLASTTAIIVQAVLLERALARRIPGMSLRSLGGSVAKILAAAAAMGVTVAFGNSLLHRVLTGRAADIGVIAGLIPVSVALYAVVLFLLRIEGRDELTALFRRFRGNGAPPAPG